MKTSKIVLGILRASVTLLVIVALIFLLVKAGGASYDMGYRVFTEPAVDAAPGRDVAVDIRETMSAYEIGTLLEEKGLIDNAALFVIQLKISAYAKDIKPGIYTLNTSLTSREMMQIMAREETEEGAE